MNENNSKPDTSPASSASNATDQNTKKTTSPPSKSSPSTAVNNTSSSRAAAGSSASKSTSHRAASRRKRSPSNSSSGDGSSSSGSASSSSSSTSSSSSSASRRHHRKHDSRRRHHRSRSRSRRRSKRSPPQYRRSRDRRSNRRRTNGRRSRSRSDRCRRRSGSRNRHRRRAPRRDRSYAGGGSGAAASGDKHSTAQSQKFKASNGSGGRRTFKDEMRDKFIAENTAAVNAFTSENVTVIESTTSQSSLPGLGQAVSLANSLASMSSNKLLGGNDFMARLQDAHQQKMREVLAKTEAATGITLPKYYNPAAVNPLKLAEQEHKKKLLWSKKKDEDINSALWSKTSMIASCGDAQGAEKFRKLMGIHDSPVVEGNNGAEAKVVDALEWHQRLEREYNSARLQTHTHRGTGLGYSQQACIDPNLYINSGQRPLDK